MILEAKGIAKRFGGVIALSNANLTCAKGRITGLLGANGSGKSTLSKIITGVIKADAGEIKYQGKTVRYKNPYEAKKDGIAMVFQNLSLIPDLTVWQNIVLGSEDTNGLFLNDKKAKAIASETIEILAPSLDITKKVSELSTGEMQIVEIAKAVSVKPQVLILDEPTAALEQAEVRNLFKCMRELSARGVAMIFTSHRIWEVMEICDDVVIFRNGRNVGSMNFDVDKKDPEKIVNYITGSVSKVKVDKAQNIYSDEVVLKVDNLNLRATLHDISFELRKGEVLGIGGLAGQGQYELMLALAGNFPGIQGNTEMSGNKVKLNTPANAVRNDILLVPGDRQLEGLFLNKSVYNNVIFPRLGLKDQPLFTPAKEYRKQTLEVVDALSIKTDGIDTPVFTLSGGNQQKVVVGKWLSFDTKVLLLADPAKGVDIGAKRDLYDYILKLVRDKGMSVILYASDDEELIEYSDRLLIMYEGRVVESLEREEISEERIIASSMRIGEKQEVVS